MRTDVAGGTGQEDCHSDWVSGRLSRRRACRARSGGFVMARQRHTARGTGFQRTALDERITPLSQGRNVDVDPVVPPIEAAGIESEIGAFGEREGGAELFDVKSFEDVIVVEDEGLEKRDELDYFFEF